jgi:hypothetical protein
VRDLFQRGRTLYQRGRLAEALELLRQSYELLPNWATSNGMALCEDDMSHPLEALRLYQRSLDEGGQQMPVDQRTQTERRATELRVALGLARLVVTSSPGGADVSVDGAALGTTPYAGDVTAGTRRLTIALVGYDTVERSLTLSAGETRSTDVTLTRGAEAGGAPPASGPARLAVTADEEGCRVSVDGERVGETPFEGSIVSGDHLVRVEGAERTWEERVAVLPDSTARVSIEFGGEIDSPWFWGLAGATAAAGIGWAAAGGYALTLFDEYEGASEARRAEIRGPGNAALDAADAMMAVTIAAAAAAFALAFFTDFDGEAEASVDFEPLSASGEVAAAHGAP